jgi:hypothetical protein
MLILYSEGYQERQDKRKEEQNNLSAEIRTSLVNSKWFKV